MQKFLTSIKLAIKTIKSNKARTTLSLLGIVIGVTSVILILSLGRGLENFVTSQVEAFGTDIIEVEVKVPQTSQVSAQNVGGMVGGTQITTLKVDDAKEMENVPNLGDWYAGVMSQQITSYNEKTDQSFILGVTSGLLETDEGANLDKGRFFSEDEDNSLAQVAVLGSKTKEKFFPNESALGKSIKIGKKKYKVIGVMKSRGVSSGFFDFDEIIFLPLKTLQKKIMNIDHIQFIIYRVKNMELVDQTIAYMESIMRDRHDIEYKNEADKKDKLEDDFAIISIAEAKEILDKVFLILNILLLGIVSVSLIVGGVGIMNTMYVAVTERTREIGLRKSVGARKKDVLLQFVFEALILTLIGGFVGVLIGHLLSLVATYWVSTMGFHVEFQVTLQSIFIGFGFSALVGVIFGYYTARKASQISPMEAIRYE